MERKNKIRLYSFILASVIGMTSLSGCKENKEEDNVPEKYIISKTANGATSVRAENSSNIRMFILKGVKATSITVDGTALSSKSSTPSSQNVGFKVSGNDTYVFLPESEWNEIVIEK